MGEYQWEKGNVSIRKSILQISIFFLLALGYNAALAQFNRDSIQHKIGQSFQRIDSVFDSTQSLIRNKIDSLGKLSQKFTHASDILRSDVSNYNRELDSIKGHLAHRIDSLTKLSLPTGQYTQMLDSIQRAGPFKDLKQAEAKLASLQSKINQPIGKFNGEVNKLGTKLNKKLNLINKEGGSEIYLPGNVKVPSLNTVMPSGVGLPTGNLSIPSGQLGLPAINGQGINPNLPNLNLPSGSIPNTNLNLPAGSLPNSTNPLNGINGLENSNLTGNLGKETNELKNISNDPQKELSELKNTGELGQAEKELGQVNQITSQAKGYSKDLKNLSKGNVDSVKQLPQALEKKALQMGDMKQFQGEVKPVDQYKALAGKANDQEAVKSLASEQVRKEAVNHFAGKEKELLNAMAQISKYKEKYASLSSIKDIPKHARNTMHGKPFIERVVSGINLQVQKRSTVLIDFNPQVGYRFNGRLTAGAGWNERLGFHHYARLTRKDRIYGPRTFTEFNFGKSLALRGEVEAMSTVVPPLITNSTPTDPSSRQWVWGIFGGIKKEYHLSKTIRGNIQMLYNFHDRFYKTSPYGDRLIVRMGFEFPMKKKAKRESK